MKIPSRLGRYEIRSLLGAGGMGEVYRAHDPHIGRDVAIKILPASAAASAERLQRFEWEARTAGMLSHPNLLVVHDIGVYEESPFIVSELLEGETLRVRLSAGRLATASAVDYAVQIANGLAALHEKGILHRDLKPENVYITRDGRVKILDFGLAKLQTWVDEGTAIDQRTEPGRLMGTAAYMSPEQARCDAVDERSDLFSFGAVLYEMLAGHAPFSRKSLAETLNAVLQSDPPDLMEVEPSVPPALARLVRRCLEKHAQARFQSASDLAFALQAVPLSEGSGQRFASELEEKATLPRLARASPASVHLPGVTTALVGRAGELRALERLLRSETTRMITLTGSGGAGKTRLAIEAARGVADAFTDGVYFVSLASLTEPDLLSPTIAQILHAPELPGRSAMEALHDHLREKTVLLLLDNFERLLPASPQLAALLSAAPAIKILVTSQSLLHLHGEHEFPLAPLSVPLSDRLNEVRSAPAAALFVERATAVNPSFEVNERNARAVGEICRRLEGLPLAIELAAARARVLSPEALLQKLEKPLAVLSSGPRDLPERQQTMRKTIEWSHALLEEGEKILFRRLAVFRGGCTLEAVEEICWWDAPAEFLDTFSALADRSLLKRNEDAADTTRFTMLEMIRTFAGELLANHADEGDLLRRRHVAHYAALAERADPELNGPTQAEWLRILALEHDNFREALEWSLRSASIDAGLRLAAALRPYWILRGHLRDARERIEHLIERADPYSEHLLKALYTAGILADAQGDYAAARRHFERKLSYYRARDDRWGVANSLNNLGIVALREGDLDRARALYQESLDFWRRLGNRAAAALSLQNLGNVLQMQGSVEEARAHYEESVSEFRALGDERGVARAYGLLADSARAVGQIDRARYLYEESLQIFIKLTDHWEVGDALSSLGHLARSSGDAAEAHALYEESLLIFRELGDMIAAARLLEAHALLAADRRKPERTLMLAAAALPLREETGTSSAGADHAEVDAAVEQMRAILGPQRSEHTWQAGLAMSLDEAVALVGRFES